MCASLCVCVIQYNSSSKNETDGSEEAAAAVDVESGRAESVSQPPPLTR